MERTNESFYYEAKSMVQYILEGHSKKETKQEFRVNDRTLDRRLLGLGYTFADLVEIRKEKEIK